MGGGDPGGWPVICVSRHVRDSVTTHRRDRDLIRPNGGGFLSTEHAQRQPEGGRADKGAQSEAPAAAEAELTFIW